MYKVTFLVIGTAFIFAASTIFIQHYISLSADAAPQDDTIDCPRLPQDYNCDGRLDTADFESFQEDFKHNLAQLKMFELIRDKVFADKPSSGKPTPSPTQPTGTPKHERVTETGIDVLIVTLDPTFSDTQKTVRDTYGFIDPVRTFQEVANVLSPYLPVRIAQQVTYKSFPPIIGYQPAEVERLVKECLSNISGDNPSCLNTWKIDYNRFFSELDICSKVNSGSIDEVWLGNYPYNGSGEGDMVGPNPYNINGHTVINTECKKNVPILSADYAALGIGANQSLEYSTAITLHSLGHRIESTLALVHKGWHDQPTNNWDHFAYAYSRYASTSHNTPPFGCGNIHFPPNAQADYEYSENRTTQSYCEAFKEFPNIQFPATDQPTTCTDWSCTQLGFMKWWYAHLPKASGQSDDGVLHNWYEYVFNPQRVVEIASSGSGQNLQNITNSPYVPEDYVKHYYDSLR